MKEDVFNYIKIPRTRREIANHLGKSTFDVKEAINALDKENRVQTIINGNIPIQYKQRPVKRNVA